MLEGAIAGLTAGGAYAVLGLCLTLMYRLGRVVNLAQAAIGVVGVYTMSVLVDGGLPYALAVLVGLAGAALVAAGLGYMMGRWFAEAGTDQRSAIAIAYLVGLLAAEYLAFGTDPRQIPGLLGAPLAVVGGVTITQAAAVCVAAAVLITAGVSVFLARTAVGLRLRALSQRPTTAELMGIPSRRLGVGLWAVTGLLATAVLLVVAPQQNSDQLSLGLMVIPACAAALVGGFKSLVGTAVGGLALGALQGALAHVSQLQEFRDVVPFVAILAILLWSQRGEVWDAAR